MTTVADDADVPARQDDSQLTANLHSFTVVAVPVVVPVHKPADPQAGGLLACEWPAGAVRLEFRRAEQGLGVVVSVGGLRSEEGSEDNQLL